jgi:hypothetical protein
MRRMSIKTFQCNLLPPPVRFFPYYDSTRHPTRLDRGLPLLALHTYSLIARRNFMQIKSLRINKYLNSFSFFDVMRARNIHDNCVFHNYRARMCVVLFFWSFFDSQEASRPR